MPRVGKCREPHNTSCGDLPTSCGDTMGYFLENQSPVLLLLLYVSVVVYPAVSVYSM